MRYHSSIFTAVRLLPFVAVAGTTLPAAEPSGSLRDDAGIALKKAATYYHSKVAAHGGYVYYYSVDLEQRWGEGAATRDQIFVQPPGTPAVGMALLRAFHSTGDRFFLDAARDAAHALVYGQLQSGGWTQVIDFNPQGSKVALYRNGKGKGRNHTSLDDNQTQAAVQFLTHLDRTLEFKDGTIHEAAGYALEALLKAQFPNGGFPQGFTGPVASHPILKATYPVEWPRVWPKEDYWNYYTLNDGLAGTVSETFLVAFYAYKDTRYRDAVRRLGDFLVLAQMPDPQPAWAQQYNFTMQPVWARKFEPPAISGLESEDAVRTLLKVYRLTGDRKYLDPIPRALAFLKKSRLPDGRMARYYELQTNRPLYMKRKGPDYFLTFDDTDLPAHYGWKQKTEIDQLEKDLADAQAGKPHATVTARVPELEKQVRQILSEMDEQGRWIVTYSGDRNGHDLVGQPSFKPGFRFLSSTVFNRNIETLSAYLTATRSN
jgi:hypothetical protein